MTDSLKGPALVLAVVCTLVSSGCTDDPASAQPLSREEAIALAQARVAEEAFMAVDYGERDTSVVVEGDAWHISFPLEIDTTIYRIGGEPHVLVSRADGEVVGVYYTR